MADSQNREYSVKTDTTHSKGQYIFYKGDEAKILDVKPVFTIKIEGKNKIVCGNAILKDVCLKNNGDFHISAFKNS